MCLQRRVPSCLTNAEMHSPAAIMASCGTACCGAVCSDPISKSSCRPVHRRGDDSRRRCDRLRRRRRGQHNRRDWHRRNDRDRRADRRDELQRHTDLRLSCGTPSAVGTELNGVGPAAEQAVIQLPRREGPDSTVGDQIDSSAGSATEEEADTVYAAAVDEQPTVASFVQKIVRVGIALPRRQSDMENVMNNDSLIGSM